MAKLSALVIPAVIDTSGIDKGVNSIRNKLSRVGGGGGSNGGGNGFSSGISPQGGHMPYGGGSPISSAMAAAFGAAAGSRATDKPRDLRRAHYDKLNSNNFISRQLDRISDFAFAKRKAYHQQGKAFMSAMLKNKPWMTYDDARLNPEYQDLMAKGDWWGGGWGYDKKGRRTVPFGQSFRGIGMMAKRASTKVGEANNAIAAGMNSSALYYGAMGVMGTAAYQMIKGAGSRNMEDRFGDITRYQGTSMYQAMRGLKADYYKTPTPTASEGFWANMRQGTGGTKSLAEKLYTGLGDVPSNAASAIGQTLGVGQAALGLTDTGTKAQQQSAGMAAAQFQLQSGGMGWNGIVGNGVYNFFSRLFS
jgi:hypothetical protein